MITRAQLVPGIAVIGMLLVLILAFTARDPLYLAPFRESQTAISAEYLVREPAGGALAYQIPVLGAPWRLPHEYPLYQVMTARLSAATGFDLVLVGRVLNLTGFGLCVLVSCWLWREWGLPAEWNRKLALLTLLSPVYLVYATAHMMESWALLPALLHLACAWRFRGAGTWGWLVLATVAGVVASLVKITTWLPAGAVLGLHGLVTLARARSAEHPRRAMLVGIGLLLATAVAFAAGVAWTEWAADVRAGNLMNEAIQDRAALRTWVFGTLGNRLDWKNWVLMEGKHLALLLGPIGLAMPVLAWLAWKPTREHPSPVAYGVRLGLAAYAVHALAFITLHLRHDYYLFGSGIFLLPAVQATLVRLSAVRPRLGRWLPAGLALSMLFGGTGYVLLKRGYHDYATEQVVEQLGRLKSPGAIITFGFDWSPRVPFAAGRKALMVTGSKASLQALPAAIAAGAGVPYAAVVVLGNGYDEAARQAAAQAGLDAERRVPFWPNGYLLLPKASGQTAPVVPPVHFAVAELAERVPGRAGLRDGLVYRRFLGPAGPELVIKRGPDAFLIRPLRLELSRIRGYFTK